ncbi:MAG TPA: DUF192 domain-containing protein [Acidimicrobiales bacterium]|nr:DUF192 domain-containing protein [Acidimicrobiales bacterium]
MLPEDLDPPDRRLPALRWIVALLLVLGMASCVGKGANGVADPKLQESRLPGFGEIGIRVEPGAARAAADWCALLAATDAQRARGLMQVTDLKGYAGMLFRFATDSQGGFWMKDTPMPLSIAFFAADGSFVSATDMDPCVGKGDSCPVYSAAGAYRYALEVPKGQLPSLGVGPGSRLAVRGPC